MTILDQIALAFNEYKLTRKEVNTIFAPLCVYHDFLEDLGYYCVSDWDPNGWEVDFWEDFYNPETKDWVTLSGSLYYGDFKFQLLDEYNYNDEYLQQEIEYAKS